MISRKRIPSKIVDRSVYPSRERAQKLISHGDEFDDHSGSDHLGENWSSEVVDWDSHFMLRAIKLAEQALSEDEVPVGAIIVHEQRIVGSGWNQREALQDPTAHAEMIAITQAAAALESWRLEDCTLYVTLEPCPMCAGAILQARVKRVVYAASDPKAGAVDSLFRLLDDPRLNHRTAVTAGLLAEPFGMLLSSFF